MNENCLTDYIKSKKIAIAAGGDSSEYSISMKSASVVQQHLHAYFDTYLIEIKGANWRHLDQNQSYEIDKNDFSLPLNGETIRFDLVFIAIHVRHKMKIH